MENRPIFVYGTLQRGEERERCWPRPSQRVERATVQGRLHDLGSYPALVPGIDRVLGELWFLSAEDLAPTLETLDEIEFFDEQQRPSYYGRCVVEATSLTGETRAAYTYVCVRPDVIRDAPILTADERGCVHWSRRGR